MKILFVCQGNTCRSPIAEGLVRTYGGDLLQAASAGLRPGTHLTDQTRQVLEEAGIHLNDHQPKPLEAVAGPVDYVISLCDVIAPGQDLYPNAIRMWWRI
ncbi:MAG: arsenate reductase ArsC, partial [Armatimonadetes bacterium]|nr:arsenate reductase ArsC [Armatimonadota bacterium]